MYRFNDLRIFLEAAAHNSFSEASRKLGMTQPALSESIKRFEADLCCTLFYRAKSGVTLTPAGKRIFDKAKTIFALSEDLSEDKAVVDKTAKFTIGVHPVVGSFLLPTILNNLDDQMVAYDMRMVHGHSRDIQAGVQSGAIDIGIVVNPIYNPDLKIKKIGTDKVCVWRSTHGRKHSEAKPRVTMFCDTNLNQTHSILRKWQKNNFKVVSSTSLELITRFVSQGLGLGIIPTRVVKMIDPTLMKVSQSPEVVDEMSVVHRPEFGRLENERQVLKIFSQPI